MTGRMVVCEAGQRNGKTHSPGGQAGFGQGTAFRRSAALRTAERGSWFRSRRYRAAGSPTRSFCQTLPWSQDAHQERSAEPETSCAASATSTPTSHCFAPGFGRAGGLRHLRAKTCDGSIPRCRKCCGRPSPWAGLRFPITLTPTAKRDSFNCSTGFTGGKASLAWSARPRSSAWSSRAAAATIAPSVKSSAGVPPAVRRASCPPAFAGETPLETAGGDAGATV